MGRNMKSKIFSQICIKMNQFKITELFDQNRFLGSLKPNLVPFFVEKMHLGCTRCPHFNIRLAFQLFFCRNFFGPRSNFPKIVFGCFDGDVVAVAAAAASETERKRKTRISSRTKIESKKSRSGSKNKIKLHFQNC